MILNYQFIEKMSSKRKANDDSTKNGKKQKGDSDDYFCDSIDDDIKLMEDISQESSRSQSSQSQSSQSQEDYVPSIQKTNQKEHWIRPALPTIDPKKDVIVFQQTEVDYYTGKKTFFF